MRHAVGTLLVALALTALLVQAPHAQAQSGVVLSEVAYHLGDDWIELYNRGSDPISLAGWTITVGTASHAPVVLAGDIAPAGFRVVPVPALEELGDSVLLQDSGGLITGALSYGTNTEHSCSGLVAEPGHSLQLRELGADPTSCDYVSAPPSPGQGPPEPTPAPTATGTATSTATPTITPTATATVAVGQLALTEVNYRGEAAGEWVELTNLGPAVTLDGWLLGDNLAHDYLQTTLAAGEVLVVAPAGSTVAPGCGGRVYQVAAFRLGNGLADEGDTVWLADASGTEHDRVAYGSPVQPGSVPPAPTGQSLARAVDATGSLGPWGPATPGPGCLGLLLPESTPTLPAMETPTLPAIETPTLPPVATPDPSVTVTPGPLPQSVRLSYLPIAACNAAPSLVPALLISEVLYRGDEFVEIRNTTATDISLDGYKLGDAEYAGDGEGMYAFPAGAFIPAQGVIVVARCAGDFATHFGRLPDFEFTPGGCSDSGDVPNMHRYTAWGRGTFLLADAGDEVLLLGPDDEIVDSVAFGSGQYRLVGLEGDARAAFPLALHRVGTLDRDDMSLDFGSEGPTPGLALDLPASPLPASGPHWAGFRAYWGDLHAHTSYSDGVGPAELAFARARQAGLHFYALTDHGYMLREVEWTALRSTANDATIPGGFLALAGFEWTHSSQGHVVVLGTKEYTTRHLPETSDAVGLQSWLTARPDAIASMAHPGLGGTFPGEEPAPPGRGPLALQEVLNGSGSDARVYQAELLTSWRNGWLVAPAAGSDTHDWLWGSGSDARTGVWATDLTEQALLDALSAGRVFASQDPDLAVGWSCGDAWMGSRAAVSSGECTAYYWDRQGEHALLEVVDLAGVTAYSGDVASGEESPFPALPSGPFWLRITQPDGDRAWTPPVWPVS